MSMVKHADTYRPQIIGGKRVASSEYRCWQMMKNRCLNTNCLDYPKYGGRGIIVCDTWISFDNFIADMGPQPFVGATLERRDNDGNYCKDNCEWATRLVQSRNRGAYNQLYNGKYSWEWAEELGISMAVFLNRAWKHRKGMITDTQLYAKGKFA